MVIGLALVGLIAFAAPAQADSVLCSDNSFTNCTAATPTAYTAHDYENHYTDDVSGPGVGYWKSFNGHNCTNYVGYMLTLNGDAGPGVAMGDGENWDNVITAHPAWGYTVDGTPAVGSIAQWEANSGFASSAGHVAYVESVAYTSGAVSSITTSEDNYPSGPFKWRTITAGSTNWPSHFLHIKDATSSTGTGVGTKMMGDVNGDGLSDAVVMFKDSGTAFVAFGQSDGTFGTIQTWAFGQSMNREYYLADVNGDGKADLVAFSNTGGYWDVSISSGSGFWAPVQWAYSEGSGSSKRFLADVNGDGKADVVFFTASSGEWDVDLSSGTGFWGPPTQWITGHGVSSSNQLMGDFNGDGKADAAIYVASSGSWYVALSTGSYFGYPGQWSYGHGLDSNEQLVGDVNGDGKSDIVYHYTANGTHGSNGEWDASISAGSGLYTPTSWSYDGSGFITPPPDNSFLADVDGDGKADKIAYYNPSGNWFVGTSAGTAFWGLHSAIGGYGANS